MSGMSAPAPTTGWMVHLPRGAVDDDLKGTLEASEDGLRFVASRKNAEEVIPYAAIRQVKRLRMSPVLMVEWEDEDRRRTAFYFSQPPPLHPAAGESKDPTERPERISPLPFKRSGKRKAQRVNATYLQQAGMSKRDLIQSWAEAVQERVRAGR